MSVAGTTHLLRGVAMYGGDAESLRQRFEIGDEDSGRRISTTR